VIAVVDPMTSQISPAHFSQFVTAPINRVFDAVRDRGALSSIFVCGDVSRNLEVMCATHADNISVDEQIDMAGLRGLAARHGKSFGGNIKLTSVLLLGEPDDARLETIRILDECGDTGFVLAPGCDLPYAVPPANLQAVAEMVHDAYQREAARASLKARASDDFADIVLPDYAAAKELIVDVITLDSTSCAPCQYMMDAAVRAAAAAGVPARVVEHKIKERAGIGMMSKLGVANLPTICIHGVPTFNSIIPDQGTLIEAIRAKAAAITD
jgi:uroporphyrinogen decarboxylase